MVPEAISTHLH